MPSAITQSMLDEIKNHNERVYATFEVDIGTTTHRFSDLPVASESGGMYLPRVSGWGEFERPFADRSYRLVEASGAVQIEDYNEVLGKSLGGANRMGLINSAARAYFRSNHVVSGDHFKFFDGRVIDWRQPRQRVYEMELGPNSLPLQNTSNNIPRIKEADWPNAPASVLNAGGSAGQIVYGEHRSVGLGDAEGMIPTIPIDSPNNRWYVSIGRLKLNLVKVFRNGTEETANWTLSHLERNGIWYTILTDDTDTADQENDTVACDVDGVETDGDGSTGTLITSGIEQVKHFLTNFVFNSWADDPVDDDGTWINVSNAPINTTHFSTTSTFLSDRSFTHSRMLTSDDSGIDVLNDFCESTRLGAFWASDWNLGILPIDYGVLDLNTGRQVRLEDIVGDTSFAPRTDELLNEITITWLRDHAADQLRKGPISVIDTNRSPDIAESITHSWIEAKAF